MDKVVVLLLSGIIMFTHVGAQQLLSPSECRIDSVAIHTNDGAHISAIVVREKGRYPPLPTALTFTIYADGKSLTRAKMAAAHGYVGIVAFSRGKGWSPDSIAPYEHEVQDVNSVIDWIIQQPWSNGKVGMYGGSYDGFSQWAATKKLHPALKTIVPYVAAIPGIGLPMENNIFLNANYGWAFYTTNNRTLDNNVYNDPIRWRTMQQQWFHSGVAYRKIDSIDGVSNPWLQRWLRHPDYDAYWQSMVPYGQEFANISIPVLTIEGYYDDGQISGLRYLQEHYKYNPHAQHYLVIGPYDHFGAQRGGTPQLRGYTVDSTALINTSQLTFEWLDYILQNGKKPALLKDKINFEVMGANEWRHVSSIEKMNNDTLTFYLCGKPSQGAYTLSAKHPTDTSYLLQSIDLADRNTWLNDYYPNPIIRDSLDTTNGLFFLSEPLEKAIDMNGCFTGELLACINKRDMDIGVVLYELMADGRYFNLSYFLGRASYAKDMTQRHLLQPGKLETIPFSRTRMVSKRLEKGSRLLVVLNINKNPFAQINYGTGKDVSDETIHDAGGPLQIKWYSGSYIKVPVWR
ncbi:MAG: CocE/NonD family hydrolase [Chitinophaga sp.]|uniref:CocE/NonD family hydrolase n=1 Tax=Chitinophaga sp. TaxID=1869181 RepID=UPI0025C5E27A|nr:CocE/NonD family hydrolase [Chitinophaga sp.]MBV8255860.1 CocE/NonD family hydrolase [Chitinophaga sp.]